MRNLFFLFFLSIANYCLCSYQEKLVPWARYKIAYEMNSNCPLTEDQRDFISREIVGVYWEECKKEFEDKYRGEIETDDHLVTHRVENNYLLLRICGDLMPKTDQDLI